jgi:hypothetical protein
VDRSRSDIQHLDLRLALCAFRQRGDATTIHHSRSDPGLKLRMRGHPSRLERLGLGEGFGFRRWIEVFGPISLVLELGDVSEYSYSIHRSVTMSQDNKRDDEKDNKKDDEKDG